MRQKLPLVLAAALLAVGLCFIAYPFVATYVNQQHSSQVISGYTEDVRALSALQRDAMRTEAQAYNDRLLNGSVVMTDPFDSDATKPASDEYERTLNVDGAGLMAYLDVPAINVHLPIYHGTSDAELREGVGHLEQTSLPVGGAGTHCVLSAHSGLSEARLFTDLEELEVGDTFQVTTLDETLTYQVYAIEVVEPDDVSSLGIRAGEDLCTLVTCTPVNVNSHRLLVHGTRIPTPSASASADDGFPWPLVVAGVAAAAAIGGVVAARRRRFRAR